MKLSVVCYSGHKSDERPISFEIDGREYVVDEILDQWYGPEDAFFKIRADDGRMYILRRSNSPEGGWSLEWFRRAP